MTEPAPSKKSSRLGKFVARFSTADKGDKQDKKEKKSTLKRSTLKRRSKNKKNADADAAAAAAPSGPHPDPASKKDAVPKRRSSDSREKPKRKSSRSPGRKDARKESKKERRERREKRERARAQREQQQRLQQEKECASPGPDADANSTVRIHNTSSSARRKSGSALSELERSLQAEQAEAGESGRRTPSGRSGDRPPASGSGPSSLLRSGSFGSTRSRGSTSSVLASRLSAYEEALQKTDEKHKKAIAPEMNELLTMRQEGALPSDSATDGSEEVKSPTGDSGSGTSATQEESARKLTPRRRNKLNRSLTETWGGTKEQAEIRQKARGNSGEEKKKLKRGKHLKKSPSMVLQAMTNAYLDTVQSDREFHRRASEYSERRKAGIRTLDEKRKAKATEIISDNMVHKSKRSAEGLMSDYLRRCDPKHLQDLIDRGLIDVSQVPTENGVIDLTKVESNEFNLNNNQFLPRLEREFFEDKVEEIINYLTNNKQIKIVSLANAHVDTYFAIQIARMLLETKHITELNVESNDIYTEGIQLMAKVLEENKTLRILKLTNQRRSPSHEARDALCKALEQNTTIIRFSYDFMSIHQNGLRDKYISRNQKIYRAEVKRTGANTPKFSSSRRRSRVLDRVATAKAGSELDQTLLKYAQHDPNNTKFALNQLASQFKRLTNHQMETTIEKIRQILTNSPYFDRVQLKNSAVTDDLVKMLGDVLKINNRIKELSLEANEISSDGIIQLLEDLKDNNSLQVLNVRHQKKEPSRAVHDAFIKYLEVNHSLLRLGFKFVEMQHESLKERYLRRNQNEYRIERARRKKQEKLRQMEGTSGKRASLKTRSFTMSDLTPDSSPSSTLSRSDGPYQVAVTHAKRRSHMRSTSAGRQELLQSPSLSLSSVQNYSPMMSPMTSPRSYRRERRAQGSITWMDDDPDVAALRLGNRSQSYSNMSNLGLDDREPSRTDSVQTLERENSLSISRMSVASEISTLTDVSAAPSTSRYESERENENEQDSPNDALFSVNVEEVSSSTDKRSDKCDASTQRETEGEKQNVQLQVSEAAESQADSSKESAKKEASAMMNGTVSQVSEKQLKEESLPQAKRENAVVVNGQVTD